jgi:uncharacterized protein YyaL (SSP411 family)
MSHSFTNHLINETSPYLLQHAHNPVNWFAWGEEALQMAKNENKVILVSIGYSACHWCHVMEKESFENEEGAAFMNANFVNIKVDREERPDLDHIYMDAVQAISGSGGWPLNVFLTPEAKPFYGGTYYPPARAFNRPSWKEVLESIAQSWKERKHEIEAQAENLVAHISQSGSFLRAGIDSIIGSGPALFTIQQCDTMFANIMKSADKEWGGFGNAPKFPQTFIIQYLLKYQHVTNNKDALAQALLSIDKMLQGGIYDHVGGGTARYSTDNEWLAPHFEKMLYDNALLIDILCDAWQITGLIKYKDAIRKTINFINNELTHNDGGFYAALDADSEGVEGKYYVWKKNEIENILGNNASLFCEYFDVTEKGNWEETNILRMLKTAEEFIASKNIKETEFNNIIGECLQKLDAERNKRIKPSLDDKIILGWNALALKAIAKAAVILQDESLKQMAEKNFKFIEINLKQSVHSSEMMHTCKDGVAKYPAFLDDYAYLIAACLQLYELAFDEILLEHARQYTLYVIEHFSDDENIFFFFTHSGQKDVIIRKKEIYDGATPSGNSVMATNLSKLSIVFNESGWAQRAVRMLQAIVEPLIKYPGSFGIWASLLQQYAVGLNEIAVVGKGAPYQARQILSSHLPYTILMASAVENTAFPMLKGKPVGAEPLLYLCKNYECLPPFKTINDLKLYMNKPIK